MRVVLDENVPVELADELPDHEVVHVKDLGWKGIGNGELLRRADEAGFEALITGDSHLPDQQNLAGFDVAVIQLRPPRLVMDQVLTIPSVRCQVAFYGPMDLRTDKSRTAPGVSTDALAEHFPITHLERRGCEIQPLSLAR